MLSLPARRPATIQSSRTRFGGGDRPPERGQLLRCHLKSEGRFEDCAPGVPRRAGEPAPKAVVIGHRIDDGGHQGPPLAAGAYLAAMRTCRLDGGAAGAERLFARSSRSARLARFDRRTRSLRAFGSPLTTAACAISTLSLNSEFAHLDRIEVGPMLGNDESCEIAESAAGFRAHVDARHLERIVVFADRQAVRRQWGGKHTPI
jgi:hypothetical protein